MRVTGNVEVEDMGVTTTPTEFPRECSNRAEALRLSGAPESALIAANRALELDPDYADARVNRAAALFALARFSDALADYEQLLQDGNDDPILIAYRGDCLRELGDYRAARRAYRAALDSDPDLVHAHANLGPLLLLFGESEAALEHCERAVALDAESATAWMNLARCRIELEQLDEAMQAFAEAFARDPRSCELCCAIGQVWQDVGDHEQAALWYGRAHEAEPDSIRVKRCLASLLCESGQPEQALVVYRELLAETPDDVPALLGSARAHWETGDADEALDAYRRSAQLRPQMAQIHCHVADVLMSIGDSKGAEQSHRIALAINPRCVGALAGLATTLRSDLPSRDTKAAEKLLTQTWLRDGARSALHIGLAHHYDGTGDHARAMTHAREGNRRYWNHRARRGWRYDPDEHVAHVDRVIATFTPELFARLADGGDDDPRPTFVVGMPRSGTTLTERMLASHPAILGIGERPFAARSLQQLSANHAPLTAVSRIDAPTLRQVAASYRQTLDAVAQKYTERPQPILRIVDKMPDNYELLGWIALCFPNARLIHVRRDPRDIALSCWMQRFGQIRWACDMAHIAERLVQHRRLMEHWRRVLPIPLFEFDYETLVAEFEETCRSLIDFLGLPWNPSCLSYTHQDGVVRTASVSQVRKPVYRSSVARWTRYRDVLSPVLERFPEDTTHRSDQ